MRIAAIDIEIMHAARVHAVLVDAFMAMTQDELERVGPGFVADSLGEMLENLGQEHGLYGLIASATPLPASAIENAA